MAWTAVPVSRRLVRPLAMLATTAALTLLATGGAHAQCVSLTTFGSAYTQNLDTLSNTAGSTTNNLTITGWFLTETGGGARDNEQYGVDTGGSNTGDTYSYGAAGSTDRALGGLQSGTLIPVIGACFTNNTGGTITSLDVAYTGEQWRIGNTAAARDDRLDFQFSTNATSLTTGTWADVDSLDFTNPVKTAGTAGALDGNNAANRTAVSSTIPSLTIANGATFWIRWNDLNASGADDGLAVDDFSVTPQGGAPVSSLDVSDVSLAEGDPPGTTTFTFAVTLTAPAGPGGVTFDIATADGTAEDGNPGTEDDDYVASSLTGQTIPAGSTGPYNFDVTVNRDTTNEPDETFFVNVTNIVGANPGDTQGQGTITNDDAPDPAPSVSSTTPANLATAVAVDANVEVTFSEPVDVAPGWFTIDCSVSGLHAAAESGGPTTFTLDPTVDFVANEVCTVTIDDVAVTDQDDADPPDTMAADFVWSFDTNPPPTLVVNEIDYDQAGTDTAEFVEIRNNGGAAAGLDPVVVEMVNGGNGAVYRTIDLPAVTLGPGEYFVVCANNTITPNCDLDVSPDTDLIQNGAPDAVALRWNGILIDTVSYEGNTAGYTETSGTGLADGTSDFVGISRFPDGADTGVNNVDLSPRCITPGAANVAADADCGPPAILGLSIDDVTLAEGQAGTRTFTFTVSLDQPAPPGGVTFDIATADGTAQDDNPATEDNDYVAQSATGLTIPEGATEITFDVIVNSDTTPEPDETFFVNLSNAVGAPMGDPQGIGTIQNDDFAAITPIHDVQGAGASSPLVGDTLTVHGIVTGVKSNGFFVQEEEADYDADPATSEGILVFTAGPPPAAAAVGNLVWVTGTVAEFVPSADPQQPPLTELTFASTVLDTTGHPLPAAVPLTATFPDPAGPFDQLERVEGMRVAVASLTVAGPTLGNVNEASATATSTGVFYGVVTGVARPFREAGIPVPDAPPSGGGTIPPIPQFDSNPERIRVDSDGLLGGGILDVGTGTVITGLVGPLDYTFRTYTILPDPGASLGVAGGPTPTAVSVPSGAELTVASYNMQRFYDTVNDDGVSDAVLTTAAFDQRLAKASLAIRDSLRMPDIVGISEMENLTTLQAVAARISSDAAAAAQPDPLYVAYLVEGNDIGGIDVGFLVKTAEVAAGTPRVEVVEVVQELAGTLMVNPDTSTSLLNDRPPLRLNAIVHHANGSSFPVTVIANHLRSLGSANSESPGSNGWATAGERVRAKRQQQAEDLANLVQSRQTADPSENIILLGDFNAFEVNDGLGHSMGVIAGTPVPDDETAVAGDGVDLVDPDFDNLFDSPPPAERYSYVFDGNAQNLDHLLINVPLAAATAAHRLEHARVNADFPETARNDGNTPVRLSDHDPLVAYFTIPAFSDGAYYTVAPCRAVDTRSSAPLPDGVAQTFTLHGVCGIPATATSVALNVTVIGPSGDGDLTVWASDQSMPAFATLPIAAGRTRGILMVPAVSADGDVSALASVAGGGSVHVAIDVMGYFD